MSSESAKGNLFPCCSPLSHCDATLPKPEVLRLQRPPCALCCVLSAQQHSPWQHIDRKCAEACSLPLPLECRGRGMCPKCGLPTSTTECPSRWRRAAAPTQRQLASGHVRSCVGELSELLNDTSFSLLLGHWCSRLRLSCLKGAQDSSTLTTEAKRSSSFSSPGLTVCFSHCQPCVRSWSDRGVFWEALCWGLPSIKKVVQSFVLTDRKRSGSDSFCDGSVVGLSRRPAFLSG